MVSESMNGKLINVSYNQMPSYLFLPQWGHVSCTRVRVPGIWGVVVVWRSGCDNWGAVGWGVGVGRSGVWSSVWGVGNRGYHWGGVVDFAGEGAGVLSGGEVVVVAGEVLKTSEASSWAEAQDCGQYNDHCLKWKIKTFIAMDLDKMKRWMFK